MEERKRWVLGKEKRKVILYLNHQELNQMDNDLFLIDVDSKLTMIRSSIQNSDPLHGRSRSTKKEDKSKRTHLTSISEELKRGFTNNIQEVLNRELEFHERQQTPNHSWSQRARKMRNSHRSQPHR